MNHEQLVAEMGHDWMKHVGEGEIAFLRELSTELGGSTTLTEAALTLTERSLDYWSTQAMRNQEALEHLTRVIVRAEGLDPQSREGCDRTNELEREARGGSAA